MFDLDAPIPYTLTEGIEMPAWIMTIDLSGPWRDEELAFEERVERIVETVKASGWRDLTPVPAVFDSILNHAAKSRNATEFDVRWSTVWDLADRDRVWMETF